MLSTKIMADLKAADLYLQKQQTLLSQKRMHYSRKHLFLSEAAMRLSSCRICRILNLPISTLTAIFGLFFLFNSPNVFAGQNNNQGDSGHHDDDDDDGRGNPCKVVICHIPPGNPSNRHTIKISCKALKAHLKHGDSVGRCADKCRTAGQCDDDNECTSDSCVDKRCVHTTVNCDDTNPCTKETCDKSLGCISTDNNAASCNDGNFCTTSDRCQSGACTGSPRNCDDVDACTTDSCDEANDICAYQPKTCVDADACTTDTCNPQNGQCVFADNGTCECRTAAECDDQNDCTADSCVANQCSNIPLAGNACEDGNLCTEGETCSLTGTCEGGSPLSCNDGNSCTLDSCDVQTGNCINASNTGAPCDDNDPCTQNDACLANNTCQGDDNSICDDNIACTNDSCSRFGTGIQCNNVPDDNQCPPSGNPCFNSVCDATLGCTTINNGSCQCVPNTSDPACNDNNVCTDDICNGIGNCHNIPNTVTCDDANACTLNDFCQNGACSGSPRDCNDGNACTTDQCSPSAGGCVYSSVSCDDGDGNVCEIDSCDPSTGCFSAPVVCPDDANLCTTESCTSPAGCTSTSVVCNDGDICTADQCNPQSGQCIFPDNGACECLTGLDCNDNNPCTSDACVGRTCQNIVNPLDLCDDGNACTLGDNCSSGSCVGTPIDCSDGSACTTERCSAGVCVTTSMVLCNDGNACTIDKCNPADGQCIFTSAGTPEVCDGIDNDCDGHTDEGCCFGNADCNDDNACTADSCNSGTCVNSLINCDDGDICTTDTMFGECDPSIGCEHFFNMAPCDDGDICTGTPKRPDQCFQGTCQPGDPVIDLGCP